MDYTAYENAIGTIIESWSLHPVIYANRSMDNTGSVKPASTHIRVNTIPVDDTTAMLSLTLFSELGDGVINIPSTFYNFVSLNLPFGLEFTHSGVTFYVASSNQIKSQYKDPIEQFWVSPITITINQQSNC